jgi:hypothetical protein
MPTSRPIALLLPLVLLAAIPARALDWTATTLEARAEPFQKTLALVFNFKNNETKTAHLLDLQTSCSCLAARSDKKVYAPGETGVITAEFSAEEPPGIYERAITVLTDATTPPQRLTVRIEIPELALLTPRSLEWKLKSEITEKSAELRANGALRISFTQATPTNESFSVRLETVIPEQVFKLIITPRTTASVANAAIRITGRDSTGHDILISAYANVR